MPTNNEEELSSEKKNNNNNTEEELLIRIQQELRRPNITPDNVLEELGLIDTNCSYLPSDFDQAGNYIPRPLGLRSIPKRTAGAPFKLTLAQENAIAERMKDPNQKIQDIKREFKVTQTVIDRIRREHNIPSRRSYVATYFGRQLKSAQKKEKE